MNIIKKFVDFMVLVIACFVASLIIYLLLLDKKHKPSTFKQWTLQHFFR